MDKLDVIYDLVKKIDKEQGQQTKTLCKLEGEVERNSDDLAEHILRTNLLEEHLELQKKATNQRFNKLEEPRATVKSIGKFIVWAGSIGGGLYGLYRAYLALQHLF